MSKSATTDPTYSVQFLH